MPLGQHQRGGNEALERARAGRDDAASAELVHQRRGDCKGARCGERDWQQPSQQLAAVSRCEHAEAEGLAQPIELLAPGLRPGGVGGERGGADADLLGDEAQCRIRDDLAGPQQPTGIAERAELQRIAELVVLAAAPLHGGQVGAVQRPAADELWFGGGQGKQALQLRLGQRATSGHGRVSQLK